MRTAQRLLRDASARLHWPLAAITVGLAMGEAAALQGVHFVSAVPLAPQVSSPAAFGPFHDLRWVWTFATGPWSMTWMLLSLLAFRSVVNATVVFFAWPEQARRPAYLVLLRRGAVYTLLALVALSPWASSTFAGAAVGFAWFILAAIIMTVIVTLLLPPGIITGAWWRRAIPWRSAGYVALSWLEIMLAALAITYSPGWVALAAAFGGGVFNAWVWRRIVVTVVRARPPRWTIPAMPVVAVLVSGGLLAGAGYAAGSRLASGLGGLPAAGASSPGATPQRQLTHPVIFVGGFNSSYAGGTDGAFGPQVQTIRFSYAGVSAAGAPLPYSALQTHQSLKTSAARLAEQITDLHSRSGRDVSVVAESEGSMVARAYFTTHPHPPVDYFIQTSPLLRPSRVFFPSSGQTGYGYAGGLEVRAILSLFRLETPQVHEHADLPFVRSLVDNAPTYRDQTLCPVPGVRGYLFLPLEGALTVYRGPFSRIQWTTVPAYHAELLTNATIRRDVTQILTGHPTPGHHGWRMAFQLIRGVAGAWQSPALPLRIGWGATDGDPAFGHSTCAAR